MLLRRLALSVVAVSAGGILALPALSAPALAAASPAATSLAATSPAATVPAPASLSDTKVTGSQVSTVLTIPATVDAVAIKAGSVVVTLGGRPVKAMVTPVQRESRSAFIVIDTSGSMGGPGIAAAAQAARSYLSVVPADVRVGLVTFSDRAHLLVAPTLDRAAVTRVLPSLKAKGETALYDGLLVGVRRLGSSGSGSRSLILLSDGADTVSKTKLAAALKTIDTSGIRVEVVGFNTADSQDSVLASLASAGGGRLLRAGSATALAGAFRAAATALAGQVRLVLDVPPGVDGSQPLVVRAVANNLPVQASATLALAGGKAGTASSPAEKVGTSPPPIAEAGPPFAAPPVAPQTAKLVLVWATAVFAGLLALGWFAISPLFTAQACPGP